MNTPVDPAELATMDHPLNFTFRIPYHADVMEKEMRRAAELLVDYERRATETHVQQAETFVAALEQRRQELRKLLGAGHHFALQQFKQELRIEATKRRQ